jgi:SpoVK/Ycf46/Vps4 family AAA+-type ATPase
LQVRFLSGAPILIVNLSVRVAWLHSLSPSRAKEWNYRREDQWEDCDIEEFEEAELDKLLVIAQKNKDIKGANSLALKINTYRKLMIDAGNTKIPRLEAVVQAMKLLMKKNAPHRWLFTENSDSRMVPWYVYDVAYEPPDTSRGSAASTSIRMAAIQRGKVAARTICLGSDEIHATMIEILRQKGFFVETPEIMRDYEKEMAYYNVLATKTGQQYSAVELAFSLAERYTTAIAHMEREGQPTKVVMDDENEEGDSEREDRHKISAKFWTEDKKGKNTDALEDEAAVLPIQPYVKVFDLDKHCFLKIHACNLKEYKWDSTLITKLVLPQEHKDLVSMLIAGADIQMEDIVKGKTGGIIVVCTGPPGTGKTLTAEVFSEEVKRPLYSVQCSQLGTDEEELEKQLQIVLDRAERWRAILLIDEADVYVHERGKDIQQNAIVGVFLRILEHYRGILFLTSNRETVIDDAIMSRATAWIRYLLPDKEKLAEIWRVLSAQYQVALTDTQINDLVHAQEFEDISGRSVKNLLKLARLLSAKEHEKITPKMIRYVSQFLDLESGSNGHATPSLSGRKRPTELSGTS